MQPISFRLRSWKAWTLDQDVEETQTTPALLRRRVTTLGRRALEAAWGLPETANAHLVLSSRHGEYSRTLSLLRSVTNRTDLSPADFTLSVHHALIGLLSIVHGNKRGHTAIAAGQESFCFGFLEAIARLNENPDEPIVLIHFDEPLPAPLATFNEPNEKPVALALALAATGEGEIIQLDIKPVSNDKSSGFHAQNFLSFIKSDLREGFSTSEHRQWRWARHVLA